MYRRDRAIWIVGAGGLLGRSLRRTLTSRRSYQHDPVDWGATDAPRQIRKLAAKFVDGTEEWSVIWCAGASVIGSGTEEFDRERALLDALLDELSRTPAPGLVLFASSAGGLYGGSTAMPIDETTDIRPISAYGDHKLMQEALVHSWCETTGGRALVARIANLYGPGQRLSKPQGLVSQLCLATLTRRPVSFYVPLDTVRDYLYVDDCSAHLQQMMDRATTTSAGETITKIVASGRSLSLGHLVGEVGRVVGRRPTVVMTRSPRTAEQGTALRFRSCVWPEIDQSAGTPLPVGIFRVTQDIRSMLATGSLA